jgi:hypothetical protein
MLKRCYFKKSKDYNRYGGIGITVAERWHSFEKFLSDIPLIDGYCEIDFKKGLLQLDKDAKSRTEIKKYSIETCTFMTAKSNYDLIDRDFFLREFEAISPKGRVYVEKNVSKFSKKHNLHDSGVVNTLKGRQNSTKGWIFRYL